MASGRRRRKNKSTILNITSNPREEEIAGWKGRVGGTSVQRFLKVTKARASMQVRGLSRRR
eukprot:15438855-Alexandrium_andersonii.AAC.1